MITLSTKAERRLCHGGQPTTQRFIAHLTFLSTSQSLSTRSSYQESSSSLALLASSQNSRREISRTSTMAASTSAISMIVPPQLTQNYKQPISTPFLNPLPVRSSPNSKRVASTVARLEVKASSSLKEKVVTGLTAAALTASMVVPDAAEAAVSPSLKNFLLSIVAGGVVLGVIVGAVIGVANFDPVKRS